MLQIPRADQGSYTGQRLHEEFGDDTNTGDRGLHVSRGICCWQPHHQGRRCWEHRLCYGRSVNLFKLINIT